MYKSIDILCREAVVGRNCRFLQGPGTDQSEVQRLREALAADRPVTVKLLNYKHDGAPFWNHLHVAPVRDARGKVSRLWSLLCLACMWILLVCLLQSAQQALTTKQGCQKPLSIFAAVAGWVQWQPLGLSLHAISHYNNKLRAAHRTTADD